ncbi:MAG: hypothetical protein GX905_02195 [Bacteroidales bacterium]|nr:hypothetical protein [Bacteroidales bacterium]
MAYCVACGVELDKGLKVCPLCDTEVLLTDEQNDEQEKTAFSRRTPRIRRPRRNMEFSKAFVFLVSFILLIPLLVTLIVDLSINKTITWSFYPITSLILAWILLTYPSFFRGYSLFQVFTVDIFAISIFLLSLDKYSAPFPQWAHYAAISLDLIWLFVAAYVFVRNKNIILTFLIWIFGMAAYLWGMNQFTNGDWFLPLGIPLLLLVSAAAILEVLIIKKLQAKKVKRLFTLGMSALIFTIFIISVNVIVDIYIFGKLNFTWSLITAAVLIPIVLFLLIVNRAPELKAYLIKKFHI